jgi:hypothetical protein
MATVRELVTKLSFKLDNSGLAEYSKNMSTLQQRAKSIQNSFQSSSLGQGIKAIRDKFKTTDKPLEIFKQDDGALKKAEKEFNDFQRNTGAKLQRLKNNAFGTKISSPENREIDKKAYEDFLLKQSYVEQKLRKKMEDERKKLTEQSKPSVSNVFQDTSSKINNKVKELTSYKDELKDLSVSERKDILDLNRIEKQATREVMLEQKKAAAEKKQQDQEERRRISQLARDRRRTNFLEGMGKVTRFANRALTGILGTATASFGFSYKDFKDYQKNKAAGKTAKTSLNSDQIRQFEAFDKVAKTFKENISSLRNAFSVALLPAITAVIKPFNEWYKINKKIIDGKLKDFALQLGSAFKTIGNAFAKVLPAINSIVNLFGGLENVILALIGVKIGGWLVGLATFLASPLGAVAALSAAFYLLYDEIKTTMEGGESYLKDFYESSYIKFIANQVEDVIKVFKEWYDALNNIFNLTDKFSSIKSLFSNIATDIGDGIKGALGDLTVYVDNKNKAHDSSLGLAGASNLANSDFMQNMAVTNKSQNVVNNINGGGIKISINSTGNIDDNAVKKLAKQLNDEFDQKLSDIFTLAMPTVIN